MATSVLSAVTYAQQLAQTDSKGIGSVFGLSLYNDALQTFHRDLLNRGIDASQVREAYRNIENDPSTGLTTFLWPSDMYMLKTIEVNWQDSTQQNYLQAQIIDVANIQDVSFSWLRANQSKTQPLIDNRGDWGEIFPTAVTPNANGVRIFYYLTPTEATTVEQAIQYPLSLDYRAGSCKMAALYYKSQNDAEMAAIYDTEYKDRIEKIIKILAPGTQQPITPQPLSITGWSY